ncbi:MAG: CDP-alcohol phosphatidyltransferase family protein [Balneolaceae bacterium]|nr:MAG: CDP-alcohol phosphatidyltransferase family protein [Balneolaceae bacterium]
MNKDHQAVRVNDSFTRGLEKKWLPRMANATPEWITPDHMTLIGIFAAFVVAAGFLLTVYSPWWLLLSNIGLVLHWYGDSLDGTLARVRKCERERYGYFVDHVCDIGTVVLIAIAMGASPLMQMEIALFVAVGYSMMNVYVHIVAYTRQKFLLSHGKIGPTEFRIILILINFVIILWNPVLFTWNDEMFRVLDTAGIAIAVLLFSAFIYKSITGAIHLNDLDTGKKE